MLWSTFSETMLSSWTLMKETLARDFDILPFLLPLLHEYFSRVRASLVVEGSNFSALNTEYEPKVGFGYKGFDAVDPDTNISASTFASSSTSTSTSTSVIPQLLLHYEPVYVDLLLSLAEQMVFTTFSQESVLLLQTVWQWLGAFTSARVHPDQGTLQNEYETAVKTAQQDTTPSKAVDSLLLPTTDLLLTTSMLSADERAGVSVSEQRKLYEMHANKALLESITRTCMEAQSLPGAYGVGIRKSPGTRSLEAVCKVRHFLNFSFLHFFFMCGASMLYFILFYFLEIVN